jgi:hypothetical protein
VSKVGDLHLKGALQLISVFDGHWGVRETMGWMSRLFRSMSRQEMDGIRLLRPYCTISPPSNPSRFLGALDILAPQGAHLFLEGGSHPSHLRDYLEAHDQHVTPRPALGTLWPRHKWFILSVERAVLSDLARLTATLPYPEICDHLHVFREDQVLLEGHDAFTQEFLLSEAIAANQIEAFCAAAGCTYQFEAGA